MTWLRGKDGTSGLVLAVWKQEPLEELQGRRADSNVGEREARQLLQYVLAIGTGTRETGLVNTIYQKLFFGMRLWVSIIFILNTLFRIIVTFNLQ